MKHPDFDESELLKLVAEVLEGEPDDATKARLHEILDNSRDARRFYRKHLELHAYLDFDYTGGLGLEAMPGENREPTNLGKSGRNQMLAIAALLILTLFLSSLLLFRSDSGSTPPIAAEGIAVLSRTLNAKWKPSGQKFHEGDPLQQGWIELASGIVEIEFFSGASVVVEGPAELELVTEKLAICHEGRLRAFVPEPAKGFTISSPRFDAVDIGTEFAMSVSSKGESEIHVIDGIVDLHQKGGGLVRQLQAGDAAKQGKGIDTLETISANGEQFVSGQQLLEMRGEHSETRYQEWRRYRKKWTDDPDTILYFDFEDHAPWERQLRNAKPGQPNGGIIGARWVSGRWPEKSALEFKRTTDRVRLNVPGEWDSVTFAAWIRIEGLDRHHNALFLSDGWRRGNPHWHIGEDGNLTFAINSVGRKRTDPLLGTSALGRWIHVAVTYDSSQQTISHFMNGRVADSEKANNRAPVVIGEAEIGNWKAHSQKQTELRSFNGRIDELLVLGRALDPGEIAELHRVGNPYR